MTRIFYLGVGTQKAATTWCYNLLLNNKINFGRGVSKEMQVFNIAFSDKFGPMHRSILAQQNNPKFRSIAGFIDNLDSYFEYFDKYIMRDCITCSADFTNEYNTLTVENFKYIKEEFLKRGIVVKVIFLMREPVSRLISMISMRHKNANINFDPGGTTAFEIALHNLKNPHADVLYSNYEHTVLALQETFIKEDIFFGFYETLFSTQLVELSNFLDIPIELLQSEALVYQNKSDDTKFFKYTIEELVMLKDHYRSVYTFVEDKFNFNTRTYWKPDCKKEYN
jgi:hypothetical protein